MRISDWSSDVCSSDLLRQLPIGRLVDRVTPQAKGARIDLYHDRVHARRDGEIKPLAVALMRLRAGCGRKTTIAVTLNNMFGDRAGFDDDAPVILDHRRFRDRSEEHTSELQSLMRISYAVFCLKKKNLQHKNNTTNKKK